MKRFTLALVIGTSIFLGFGIGKWMCAPPRTMLNVSFVPNTGTNANPWGDVRRIEIYYLKHGQRILHGESLLFKHEAGHCTSEIFENGERVEMGSGPTFKWPFNIE